MQAFSTILVISTLVLVASAAVYNDIRQVPTTVFDFIIIGGIKHHFTVLLCLSLTQNAVAGGTAGAVVGNRLTEVPEFQVLVIEAGPTYVTILNPNF